MMKNFKDENKENFGIQAHEEIVERNEKMKQYTLRELNYRDFIFTDWLRSVPNKEIRGPEEVRKRIRKFLKKSNILSDAEARKI